MNGPAVITLCGSMHPDRWPWLLAVAADLTYKGALVLHPYPEPDEHAIPEWRKHELDTQHRARMSVADQVMAVVVDGYQGQSTRDEMRWAHAWVRSTAWALVDPDTGKITYMQQQPPRPEQPALTLEGTQL